MAAQAQGIWNQISTMHTAVAKAMDNPTSGSSSDSDSATISANDFLTLLGTEMQNQDPTATTYPNEYINQLVQVNSLEQLISINQTLTADSTPSASGSGQSAHAVTSGQKPQEPFAGPQIAAALSPLNSAANKAVSGNLTIPPANAAAIRVAQALEKP